MRRRDAVRLTWALLLAALFGATIGVPEQFYITLTALAGASAAMTRGKDDD